MMTASSPLNWVDGEPKNLMTRPLRTALINRWEPLRTALTSSYRLGSKVAKEVSPTSHRCGALRQVCQVCLCPAQPGSPRLARNSITTKDGGSPSKKKRFESCISELWNCEFWNLTAWFVSDDHGHQGISRWNYCVIVCHGTADLERVCIGCPSKP